jgi:hypothetical protein
MRTKAKYAPVLPVLVGAMVVGALGLLGPATSVAEAKRFASPAASPEYWHVFCNRNGRNVELGIHKPNNNYTQMAGPFNNEPEARDWVNRSCSSWRCDWNGACVGATGGNAGTPCPPGTYLNQGVFGQGAGCVPY